MSCRSHPSLCCMLLRCMPSRLPPLSVLYRAPSRSRACLLCATRCCSTHHLPRSSPLCAPTHLYATRPAFFVCEAPNRSPRRTPPPLCMHRVMWLATHACLLYARLATTCRTPCPMPSRSPHRTNGYRTRLCIWKGKAYLVT
jgi:hypothetical protein